MRSKLTLNKTYIYYPTDAMSRNGEGPGFFIDEGDVQLKGCRVIIIEPSYANKDWYYIEFLDGKYKGERGSIVGECLKPVCNEAKISLNPWNKPHV